MARRRDSRQATETLEELDSLVDRLGSWATQNPVKVLTGIGLILLLAATAGVADWYLRYREDRAAVAVARVESAYLRAMGTPPGSAEVIEPANPETARQVRQEYVERFLEVADDHAGTAAAVSALLEAGALQQQLGEAEAALATFERAREEADASDVLGALALERLAQAYESHGRWLEAGEAHAAAGGYDDFPTRRLALADAARCYAEAGDAARALATFERAEALDDSVPIPAHISSRLRELRAAQER